MSNYCAPWSRTVKIVTYAVNAMLLGVCLVMFFAGLQQVSRGQYAGWFIMLIPFLFLLMPLVAWYLAPKGYSITETAVYVRKKAKDEEFPFDKIEAVEIRDSREIFASTVRVSASGGYYGAFGLFSGGVLSSFRALATNDGPMIVLRMKKGEPVVISPERPHDFARELEGRARLQIKVAHVPAGEIVMYRPPFSPSEKAVELVALLLLIGVFAVAAYFWNSLFDTIPTHFGFTGEPDAWGPKRSFLILPVFALGSYLLFTGIVLFVPKIARTPPAPPKARRGVSVLRVLLASTKVFTLSIIGYVMWRIALTSLEQAQGLGGGFIVIVLLVVCIFYPALLLIGLYVWKAD